MTSNNIFKAIENSYPIMLLIDEHSRIRFNELCKITKMEKNNLAYHIKSLKRYSLIESCPLKWGEVGYSLTDKGYKMLRGMEKSILAYHQMCGSEPIYNVEELSS